MALTVAPFPYHQFFDNNGDPAAGYKLFTYQAGTNSKEDTYSEANPTGQALNTNPIILDSAGRARIFLLDTSYKFVLAPPTDTDPPASPLWTIDNVTTLAPFNPTLDIEGVAGEAISEGQVCHLADGAGGLTGGRWYRTDADNFYQSSSAPIIGIATTSLSAADTGTFRIMGRVTGLSSLSTGSRYYVSATAGALTSTKLPLTRLVGYADSVSSLILTPQPLRWESLTVTFGTAGGAALTSAQDQYVYMEYPVLVTGWTLLADQAGSLQIDVRSDTYANYPPTSADSISGSEDPTLSAAIKNQNLGITTWTNIVPQGNVLRFHIEAATTVTYASLTLQLLRI